MDDKYLNSHEWDRNLSTADVGWSAFDQTLFQRGLDRIVGVEPDGTKRWRLVWGCDGKVTEIWDRVRGEYRPRYAWRKEKDWRKTEGGLDEQYHNWICVPRFFVECLVPTAARDPQAERATVQGAPDGESLPLTDRRLPGADYMLLTPVYEHSNLRVEGDWRSCCLAAQRKGRKCFGLFRLPDQKDLDYLAEEWANRVAEHGKPGELTERDLAIIFFEEASKAAAEKAKKAESDIRLRQAIRARVQWEKRNGHNPGSLKRAISLPE